jgi:phage FluMu gp28-like protein
MTDAPALEDLFAPSALPDGHDPLAEGIMMAHQRAWLEDSHALKIAAKGRRTGITYAEALDDTLIAAAARSAGGDNVYYIGDTKDKGVEFVRYVAHFARIVARELATVDEFLFEDRREDGTSNHIAAYRVRFASGHQVVALSSRPASIRGLQGVVVIDEAAFHADVSSVLDAVNALLIWGGRIRIISSHNGQDNPFNRLIEDTRKGLYDYRIHHIPFSLAVQNGLYERVCLMRGWAPTAEAKAEWLAKIIRSYGPRHEQRDQELEAIPAKSSGVYLPRSLVQAAQIEGVPILRYVKGEAWYLDDRRLDDAALWFRDQVKPILDRIDRRRRHFLGQDFGRDGDLSVIALGVDDGGGVVRSLLMIELRRIPFDVQQFLLFEILGALPPAFAAALDARGNGQSHAEHAAQSFGIDRVACIKATAEWYALHFPLYRAALEDRSMLLPPGEDVIADHRLAVLRNGRPTIGEDHVKGEDGEPRHGDSLVALLLVHVASGLAVVPIEFGTTGQPRATAPGTMAGYLEGVW